MLIVFLWMWAGDFSLSRKRVPRRLVVTDSTLDSKGIEAIHAKMRGRVHFLGQVFIQKHPLADFLSWRKPLVFRDLREIALLT